MTALLRLRPQLVKTGFCLLLTAILAIGSARSQSLLNKSISVSVKQKKLTDILNEISKKGGFYFSYDGRLFSNDSLMNIEANELPVRSILNQLFSGRYEVEERNNYVIITAALKRLSLINPDLTAEGNFYSVSGIVIDERTGERLMNASVYEKRQLVSALTDDHGYFRMKVSKNQPGQIAITAGKLLYKDTTILFLHPVRVNPGNDVYSDTRRRGNRVEGTGFGRILISTRQKIQSMNIPDFFASRSFQVSLVPGLSSRGMFSPQVINRLSLNLGGGYTAGTNGFEFGGLFNINKQDSKYLQMAGVFNLTGGNAIGLQIAGAHNRTLDTLKGVQISLFTNRAEEQVSGVQISALHNETRRLKGVQIGLVNIADTSGGVSIGVLNIIRNGFYKVSYTANDLANTNITLKTGTHRFYSALLTSVNVSGQNKFYAFGLGVGHDFMFSDKVYVSAEGNYQFAYTGSLDDRWLQGKLLLNVQLSRNFSLFAGPTYNKYSYTGSLPGYQSKFQLPDDYVRGNSNPVKKWVGWEAGIAYEGVFKPAKKVTDNSSSWYINLAATTGFVWDGPYGFASGGEVSLQKDLGENLTGTLSTGYTHITADRSHLFATYGQFNIYAQPQNFIPVKAGVRLKFGKTFYIGGETGVAFGDKKQYITNIMSPSAVHVIAYAPYRSLMYAVTTGFSFRSGLETGVKFEDYGLQSQYKQLALRLGYRIRLGK